MQCERTIQSTQSPYEVLPKGETKPHLMCRCCPLSTKGEETGHVEPAAENVGAVRNRRRGSANCRGIDLSPRTGLQIR
jgi:hypothetical protein